MEIVNTLGMLEPVFFIGFTQNSKAIQIVSPVGDGEQNKNLYVFAVIPIDEGQERVTFIVNIPGLFPHEVESCIEAKELFILSETEGVS
jgi:hypothetical protein